MDACVTISSDPEKRAQSIHSELPDRGWHRLYIGLLCVCGFSGLVMRYHTSNGIIDESLIQPSSIWTHPFLLLYRGIAGVVILEWFWGTNVWIWNQVNALDYVSLFQLDEALNAPSIWKQSMQHSVLLSVNLTCFLLVSRPHVSATIVNLLPATLFVGVLAHVGQASGPATWKSIVRVIASPWTRVTFLDIYLGDVATSFIHVGIDLLESSCLLVSQYTYLQSPEERCVDPHSSFQRWVVPVCSVLPMWWRFGQNIHLYYETHERFPYVPNAVKYASAQLMLVWGHLLQRHADQRITMVHLWVIGSIVTTTYQLMWDIVMDWKLLRGCLIFRPSSLLVNDRNVGVVHLSLVLADLVLRFAWILPLVLVHPMTLPRTTFMLGCTTSVLELFRRSMWGLFRVEAENLTRTKSMSSSVGRKIPGIRVGTEILALVLVLGILTASVMMVGVSSSSSRSLQAGHFPTIYDARQLPSARLNTKVSIQAMAVN